MPRERCVQLRVHAATRVTDLFNARQILAQGDHAQRIKPLDDHFIGSHRFLLKLRESDLDPFELFGLLSELGASFGLAQAQDPPQLLHRDVLVDELRNFRQRHTQVAKDKDAMQSYDLVGRVVPIPGALIDVGWFQQTQIVIVSQGAYRHLREASHRADPVHMV